MFWKRGWPNPAIAEGGAAMTATLPDGDATTTTGEWWQAADKASLFASMREVRFEVHLITRVCYFLWFVLLA